MLFVAALLACATPAPAPGVVHHDAAASAAFLQAHPSALVVDVRTPGEFARGHLEGAVNVDYNAADFAERVAGLPRDQPVLVHCQSGGRSRAALAAFTGAGFTDVHHLDGGFGAWTAAGLPAAR
jgi:rhodanese-related sulfurtransferase